MTSLSYRSVLILNSVMLTFPGTVGRGQGTCRGFRQQLGSYAWHLCQDDFLIPCLSYRHNTTWLAFEG